MAVDNVTAVWGSYGGNSWTATTLNAGTAPPANGVNNLLAFTSGGVRYSTGVNDAALTGAYTPASFQAFSPNINSVPAAGGLNAIPLSGTYNPTQTRATYLSDGVNGLDLNTALFNIPAAPLKFSATVGNADATTDAIPDVLVTQVGSPSSNADRFYFVDASNAIVGNFVSVNFTSVAHVARQNWQFWNPNHTKSSVGDGARELRMRAYYFSDFGIAAANMGSIVGFVQELSGDSDVAFIAYNRQAVTTPATLGVQKTNNTNVVLLGATTNYTVTLTNSGGTSAENIQWSDNASNVVVTGITPGTVGAGSNAGTCTTTGCTGITLAEGTSVTYTVTANVTGAAGATATNAAIVHGGNCTHGSPSTCTSTDTDTIVSADSVSVTKSNNVDRITAGGQTVYWVTLTNTAATNFSGLAWTDTPSGVTVNSITPVTATGSGSITGICRTTPAPMGCSGITLAAGQSISYQVTATATAAVGSNVSNTATVSGGTCSSASVAGCASTDTDLIVGPANLRITKTNGVDVLAQGSNTTYTVTLTNSGGTAASSVQWADAPVGVAVSRIVEGTTGPNSSAGVCTATACTGIMLAPGESITYLVDAAVTGAVGPANARNTATLSGGNCSNGTPIAACTAIDTDAVVTPATLGITKDNGVSQVTEGTTTSYTVAITNSGGMAAGNVEWTDIPVGMEVQSITANAATGGNVAGTCALAPLVGCTGITVAANSSVSYTVVVQITALASATPTVSNTASVSGANCPAGNPCTATDTDTLQTPASFTVQKSAAATVLTSEPLNYSFTVGNSGQTTAPSGQLVTVREELPAGVTYVGATTGTGVSAVTCTGMPLVCSVTLSDALVQGATAIFTLQTTSPATAGSVTNYASVDTSGGTTPPVPGVTCTTAGMCTEATTVVNTPANVSVRKSNGVDQVTEGSTTTYTVTLTNSGGTGTSLQWTDTATGLEVTGIAASLVGPNSLAGSCTAGGCTDVTLAANESITYTVSATITGAVGSNATNTANVTGGNCSNAAPCTSTDTDKVVAVPVAVPVPVDSRVMLLVLGLFLLTAAWRHGKARR